MTQPGTTLPGFSLPGALSEPARRFVGRRHGLLIDGQRTQAADGRTFETVDPATGLPLALVANAGPQDVDRAVVAARFALEQGPWGAMPAAERALLLHRLADLLVEHADELAELEAVDNGKPVRLAKAVDVASAIAELRHFGLSRHRCGQCHAMPSAYSSCGR